MGNSFTCCCGSPGRVRPVKGAKEDAESGYLRYDVAELPPEGSVPGRPRPLDGPAPGDPLGIEGLVMEGGGAKGAAYVGALLALEERGVLRHIKRYAGSSAGAMTACLLAVGYSPLEVLHVLKTTDLEGLVKDGPPVSFWHLGGVARNVMKMFGISPGNTVVELMAGLIKAKMGVASLTFAQLYRRYGVELAVTATNLSRNSLDWLHVKTTPDMPIAHAIRITMSLPLLLWPFTEKVVSGEVRGGYRDNYFVDGGLLMNYPMCAFDGWFLSMKPEDNFMTRLMGISTAVEAANSDLARIRRARFGDVPNMSVLGLRVLAEGDSGMEAVWRGSSSEDMKLPPWPNTPLAKKGMAAREERVKAEGKKRAAQGALAQLTRLIDPAAVNSITGELPIDHIMSALKRLGSEYPKCFEALYPGLNGEWDEVHKKILAQTDGSTGVTYNELATLAAHAGVDIMAMFSASEGCNIDSVGSFAASFYLTFSSYVETSNTIPADIDRTAVINTGYVNLTDFKMEPDDFEWLKASGAAAVDAYYAARLRQEGTSERQELHQSSVADEMLDEVLDAVVEEATHGVE